MTQLSQLTLITVMFMRIQNLFLPCEISLMFFQVYFLHLFTNCFNFKPSVWKIFDIFNLDLPSTKI